MKRRTSGLRYSTAGILGQGLIGSLFLTVRFQTMGEDHLRPFPGRRNAGHLRLLARAPPSADPRPLPPGGRGARERARRRRVHHADSRAVRLRHRSRLEYPWGCARPQGTHPRGPARLRSCRNARRPTRPEPRAQARSPYGCTHDGAAAHSHRCGSELKLARRQLGSFPGAQTLLDGSDRLWRAVFSSPGMPSRQRSKIRYGP